MGNGHFAGKFPAASATWQPTRPWIFSARPGLATRHAVQCSGHSGGHGEAVKNLKIFNFINLEIYVF